MEINRPQQPQQGSNQPGRQQHQPSQNPSQNPQKQQQAGGTQRPGQDQGLGRKDQQGKTPYNKPSNPIES